MVNIIVEISQFSPGDFPRRKTITKVEARKGKVLKKIEFAYEPGAKIDLEFNPSDVQPGNRLATLTSVNGGDSWTVAINQASAESISLRFTPYMLKESEFQLEQGNILHASPGAQLPLCFRIDSKSINGLSYQIFISREELLLPIPTPAQTIATAHNLMAINVPSIGKLDSNEIAPMFSLPRRIISDELYLVCEVWNSVDYNSGFAREQLKLKLSSPGFADAAKAKIALNNMYGVLHDVQFKVELSDKNSFKGALQNGIQNFSTLAGHLQRLDGQIKKEFLANNVAGNGRYTLAANLYRYESSAIDEFQKRIDELIAYSKQLEKAKNDLISYLEKKAKDFESKSNSFVGAYCQFLSTQPATASLIETSVAQMNKSTNSVAFTLPRNDMAKYSEAMQKYAFEVFIAILKNEKYAIEHLDAELLRQNSALLDLIKKYHRQKTSLTVEEQKAIVAEIDRKVAPGFDYDSHSGSILGNVNYMLRICQELQSEITNQLTRNNYLLTVMNELKK